MSLPSINMRSVEHMEAICPDTDWTAGGQPWRTEPEIGEDRQAELAARKAIPPDIEAGEYPFKGIRLTRADVEWLLATHDDGRGPVDLDGEGQRDRTGIDLRGADLSYARLSGLPLARTACYATPPGAPDLTQEQRRMAAIDFQGADLVETHLDGACLDYANMGHADLRGCHLDGASLWGVNLREANCDGAHLERTDLWNAHLEGAFLYRAYLTGASLHESYLAGAHVTDLHLTDEDGIGPSVADVHWEGVNLSVVNWSEIRALGDDYRALRLKNQGVVMDGAMKVRWLNSASRANQQLALALQAQGMTGDANRFFYRSRLLERKLLALQGGRRTPLYLLSLLLDLLTGYGYRMGRMIVAYLALIAFFAALYYGLGQAGRPHVDWSEAGVLSITAFHGRDFSAVFAANSAQSVVAAAEAITGFLFEGIFIAMLAQRVFRR